MSNQDQNSSGVSRRGFLKGVGLGTAATGVLSAVKPVTEAATANSNIRGPGEIPISLKINGKSQKVNVEPRVTLLDTLRKADPLARHGTVGTVAAYVIRPFRLAAQAPRGFLAWRSARRRASE